MKISTYAFYIENRVVVWRICSEYELIHRTFNHNLMAYANYFHFLSNKLLVDAVPRQLHFLETCSKRSFLLLLKRLNMLNGGSNKLFFPSSTQKMRSAYMSVRTRLK